MLAGEAAAQDPAAPEASTDEFRQTAIPAELGARFTCHQAGAEIVSVEGVTSFAPARVQGVMTFSLTTRAGETHLIYLGAATACRLTVAGG